MKIKYNTGLAYKRYSIILSFCDLLFLFHTMHSIWRNHPLSFGSLIKEMLFKRITLVMNWPCLYTLLNFYLFNTMDNICRTHSLRFGSLIKEIIFKHITLVMNWPCLHTLLNHFLLLQSTFYSISIQRIAYGGAIP